MVGQFARPVAPVIEMLEPSGTARKPRSAARSRDGKRGVGKAHSSRSRNPRPSWRLSASETFLVNTLPIVLYRAEANSEFSGPRRMGPALAEAIGIKAIGFLVNRDLWPSRIHPDERGQVIARMAACRPGDTYSVQYRILCADDAERVFVDQGFAIAGRGGRVEIRGVCLDITDKIEMERHLLWARRLETMGRHLDDLAHDFMNMLSVTIWNLDGLKLSVEARGIESLNRDRVGIALSGANSSAELFRELTSFAKRLPRKVRVIDPIAMIERMDKLFRLLIGEDGTLEVDLPDGLWPISADEAQIESLLLALVLHASERAPPPRWVRIQGANVTRASPSFDLAAGDYLALSISDGSIAAEDRDFDDDALSEASSRPDELTLRLVRDIAGNWSGRLAVGKPPNAQFRLLLPRTHPGK